MKSLTLKKEEAAPRPENAYTWYLYQGKPFLVRSVTGKRSIMLGKGDRYGMRASHDGKKTRLVTKTDGITIVYTLDAHTLHKLTKESKLVKKATAAVGMDSPEDLIPGAKGHMHLVKVIGRDRPGAQTIPKAIMDKAAAYAKKHKLKGSSGYGYMYTNNAELYVEVVDGPEKGLIGALSSNDTWYSAYNVGSLGARKIAEAGWRLFQPSDKIKTGSLAWAYLGPRRIVLICPPKLTKTKASVEVAFQIPDWFKELPKEGQDKYLKDHPNSKLAKTFKAKQNKPADTSKSPTNFKGPASKKTAMGDDPRKERNIVSMMDKLAKMAADAKAQGTAAPNYDLCKVSIPGTNLFCKGNKGIPRKDMPQLKGKPVEGSWADKNLEKDKSGEVSGEDAFKAFLKQSNVKLDNKRIDVAKLKATQTELVGPKVAGMLQALKKDPKHPGITAPIFVSKDGYILDGHHRWAAMVGLNMADGKVDPVEMDIIEVDMGIEDLVKETNDFASKIGVAQKAAKTTKEGASLDGYKGCCG